MRSPPSKGRFLTAFAVVSALCVAPHAKAGTAVRRLSAVELFGAADQAQAAGKIAEAKTMYEALAKDPDAQVRAEARFREGVMLAALKRYREAAVLFRALLDEKPSATRVRLELARVLAAIGDERAARRELRQAKAAGLPQDVAIVVNQFADALHSSKPFGGSVGLALAPDSNINRATSAQTLDTVIAPLTLSRDARSRSGIGFEPTGQLYGRIPLNDDLALTPRLSGQADLYRASEFDDIAASAQLGLEWRLGHDQLTPSAGMTWRWYGGRPYADTLSGAVDWIHPISPTSQLEVQTSAGRIRNQSNDLQSGAIFAASAAYERALNARTGVSLTVDLVRETAKDPGYATWSGGATLLGWRNLGQTSVFLSGSVHRLEGDARLFLFPERRQEWLYQATAGATFRQMTWQGFAPSVRVTFEENESTVGIYAYHRVSTLFGVTRAF